MTYSIQLEESTSLKKQKGKGVDETTHLKDGERGGDDPYAATWFIASVSA